MTRTYTEKTRAELIQELEQAHQMIAWMREYSIPESPATELIQGKGKALQMALENMPASIALFDLNLQFMAASVRWRELYGLTNQLLIGKSYYELFPCDNNDWRDRHAKCLRGEVLKGEEAAFCLPNGREAWVKWEIRPWFDRGEIGGLIMMLEPVTEQRRLRLEIERSRNELLSAHAYLQSVLEAASEVGIIVTNQEGVIRLFNSGAQKMLGYTSAEVEGLMRPSDFREVGELKQHSDALVSLFPGPLMEARIRKLKETGVERGEWTLVCRDGTPIVASVTISPLKDQNDEIIGSVGIFLDITSKKEAEWELHRINTSLEQMVADRTQDLRLANEEIKNFAYIVSHDLRVPLVNIKGFSGELEQAIRELNLMCEEYSGQLPANVQHQMKFLLMEDIPESMHFINNSAGKMDTMINGILQLSRMGRRKLDFEQIDTDQLVAEVLDNSKHLIEEKQVDIQIGELPMVLADRISMEQIFSNLINNAILYLRPEVRGRIEIGSQADEVDAIFYVRDNGRGISEKDIKRIFNIFSRAGKNNVRGEGLGLSYVRTLVRRHGGEIACLSEPGIGSTFSFSIPLRPEKRYNEALENATEM